MESFIYIIKINTLNFDISLKPWYNKVFSKYACAMDRKMIIIKVLVIQCNKHDPGTQAKIEARLKGIN